MIFGSHFLLYSQDPEADRAFLRDIIELPNVDAGGGWPIFKLPPAEIAVHPSESSFVQRHADEDLAGAILYLMCEDLTSALTWLKGKGVDHGPIQEAPWGVSTTVPMPSGGRLGLYQPRHATALDLP